MGGVVFVPESDVLTCSIRIRFGGLILFCELRETYGLKLLRRHYVVGVGERSVGGIYKCVGMGG